MHDTLFMLALVLTAAFVGGRIAARFGYPTILGEITAGIVLGPPLIGLLDANEAIDVLGDFGVLLMMLYIGIHLDLGDLRKASKPGLLAAIGGFIVPTALGILLMLYVGRPTLEALFVGLAMGVTALATKTRILVDLKILDTRVAHVLVAGAVLSDVAVLIIFASIIGQGPAGELSTVSALLTGAKAITFAFGAWLIGGWLLPMVKRRIGREMERGAAFVAVIVFGLVFAWAAELAGIHAILGAFVAGLFIDKDILDAKTSRDVQQKLSAISIGVLAPFFFVSAGFAVSFDVFRTDLWLLVGVIVLATVGKVVGTAVFYLFSGNGWREGIVVGAGMNGRGAVEIIVAEIALAQGLIGTDVFSILVFMALFTTAVDPIMLTIGVKWLRGRGELVQAGDRSGVVIVGADPIALTLAAGLAEPTITVIDTNRRNLAEAERMGLRTHQGNALDELTLKSVGTEKIRQLIAATTNAEVNVLVAQLARDFGIPDVCALLNDADAATFAPRLSGEGIDVIRAPDDLSLWASDVATGSAVVVEIDLSGQATELSAVPIGGISRGPTSPLFPLVALANGSRSPFTMRVSLTEAETVVCLRRTVPGLNDDVGASAPVPADL